MVAPKGNTNGTKLKDPSIRQMAYKQYCDHLATGNPKESWCFEHPSFTCTFKTMEKYIRDNPVEFPPIHKEVAMTKRYNVWLEKGKNMVDGLQDKCQPAVYQMFMRNMFDWDKEAHGKRDTSEPLVKRLAQAWRGEKVEDE